MASIMTKGSRPVRYITVEPQTSPRDIEGAVVEEALACISVNGEDLATFMCSPRDLDKMALGFLYNEGIIQSLADIRHVHISKNEGCVDVWLHHFEGDLPRRKVITAGCGGGVTFDDLSGQHAPLVSNVQISAGRIAELMRQMHLGATLYQLSRGIHTAALADSATGLLLQMEDLGRHNCLDKLCGAALQEGLATRDKIILSSGRISSEMLNKARRLEIPIICSRTSPTSLSVSLAEAWNMTIIGYVRQERMRIYSHPERIVENHE